MVRRKITNYVHPVMTPSEVILSASNPIEEISLVGTCAERSGMPLMIELRAGWLDKAVGRLAGTYRELRLVIASDAAPRRGPIVTVLRASRTANVTSQIAPRHAS